MQCWKIQLLFSNNYYGDVSIQRGIYQGESLSLLLFVMVLMPLSTILNSTNRGFAVDKDRLVLNHLLYLGDLKLFAKSRSELDSLVKTVKLFSDAIHMRFGIEKCATASISRGKLVVSDDLVVTEDTVISAMNAPDSYKYLGVFELDQLKERLKDIIIAKCRRKVCKLLKSALNGQNIISAINMNSFQCRNTWLVAQSHYYSWFTSVLSLQLLQNLHLSLKTVKDKKTLKLGKQNPCTDSLSERSMVFVDAPKQWKWLHDG